MKAAKTICGVVCLAIALLWLPTASVAGGTSLTITNVVTQYTDPSTGDIGTAFDIGWPAAYAAPSYSDCSASITYNDGQTLSSADQSVIPDPNNVYAWVAQPNATYYDVNDNPVFPTATQIQASCTLHRTVHYRQREYFSGWYYKRGSARAWATGDCRAFIYISGTLTVDCRRALRGEQVAYYVRHPGYYTRCYVQWGAYPAVPGGRHVSCKDLNSRTAEVLFNVSPGGEFTITQVSVLAHWSARVRRSRNVYTKASGTWTNPNPPSPPSCPTATASFSGTDDSSGQQFTICKTETMTWTLNDTCDGGMYVDDDNSGYNLVDSFDSSGSTTLSPGSYYLDILACGAWTIHVG